MLATIASGMSMDLAEPTRPLSNPACVLTLPVARGLARSEGRVRTACLRVSIGPTPRSTADKETGTFYFFRPRWSIQHDTSYAYVVEIEKLRSVRLAS